MSFSRISAQFGYPEIDLFASVKTRKCDRYYSWFPDPQSIGVDAFTFLWKEFFYAFPPFSLIIKVLNKVLKDKAKGIIVVPNWKSQAWFPMFQNMIVSEIVNFAKGDFNLICPYNNRNHPLSNNLTLLAAVISG